MTTYNVALKEGVDYDTFWHEMESKRPPRLSNEFVPVRNVDIVNERPTSLRQCWYDLTEEEAEKLRNDPRIYCVEIPPEHRDDIKIKFIAWQNGKYQAVSGINPPNTSAVNWGLRRTNTTYNSTQNYSAANIALADLDYAYTLDGTNVDVVIMDAGCQLGHPEWQDKNGITRLKQIDWYAASGVSGTMPATFYSDNRGHGTHVTGIAAGKTYGRAKNANIYIMTLNPTVPPTEGIDVTNAFDCIRGWHNNKAVNPLTGVKNPTVVNMSWGYFFSYFDEGGVGTVNYRGSTYTGYSTNYGMNGFSGSFGVRVSSVDIDVAECIAAGVIFVGAAGNDDQSADVPGGLDYNNYYLTVNAPYWQYYYMRGSSPASADGVITVGSTDASATTESKSYYSSCGPRTDLYAPGSEIISAMSSSNIYSATAYYPDGTNSWKIANLTGTSMASPQVTGMVAQLLQIYPGATQQQMRDLIINYSVKDVLANTNPNSYTDSASLKRGYSRYAYQPFNNHESFKIQGNASVTNASMK
jgi:hypothetical protein